MIQMLLFFNLRHFCYKATGKCCCTDRSMKTLPELQLCSRRFLIVSTGFLGFKLACVCLFFYVFQHTFSWLFHTSIFTRFLLSTYGTPQLSIALTATQWYFAVYNWFDRQINCFKCLCLAEGWALLFYLICLQLSAVRLCSYMEPVLGWLPLSRTQNVRHIWRLKEEASKC